MSLFAARAARRACLAVALSLNSSVVAGAAAETIEYRVLATNKTSTMKKEMRDAAAAGFRFGVTMVGDTASGKGQSWSIAKAFLEASDPSFSGHITYGLSSGEGLIERLRDDDDGDASSILPVVAGSQIRNQDNEQTQTEQTDQDTIPEAIAQVAFLLCTSGKLPQDELPQHGEHAEDTRA